MESKKSKPWLTSTGVEVPVRRIKEICETWSLPTWEAYLDWLDSPVREHLLDPDHYVDLADRESTTIFEQIHETSDQTDRTRCDKLLSYLPPREKVVLRLIFFDGLTARQIAKKTRTSKSRVHELKTSALLRLRDEFQGDKPDTRHLIGGTSADVVLSADSLWTRSSEQSPKEAKVYDPSRQTEEFENIQHASLKSAVASLSEQQQRIIYLWFWCDLSANEIARELACGANSVEQVLEASISKLKRIVVDAMANPNKGESKCV